MKISLNQKSARKAFTLIEMIGVLAVIAILASLLIPKIFEAINNARISNAALSYNSVKTGTADHYAKYGTLPITNSWDKMLLQEAFMDKLFQVKIGDTNTHVESVAGTSNNVAVAFTSANAAYNLDGDAGVPNDATGSVVVQAVISGVAVGDAFALSTLLDGPSLSAPDLTSNDSLGRVKYSAAASPTTVFIYITHR